ncbi:hypothetical protein CC80DRAFT_308830 [Byssothecium circinans]|uniref:Uncharacterized protein n=1 Tax=Byssothecium circinans TaxID=147558 RepID=A0A6A5U4D4_9PLEO|nr:hypothetical protein CC80DRAFT_308830 [Byssothecium circinans]
MKAGADNYRKASHSGYSRSGIYMFCFHFVTARAVLASYLTVMNLELHHRNFHRK